MPMAKHPRKQKTNYGKEVAQMSGVNVKIK
jgi:hypothetical protein